MSGGSASIAILISAAVPNVKELVSEKQPIQDLAAPAAGIWSRFNAWIQCGIGEEGWEWLERNPELLDAIVRLADKTETQANQIAVLNDRVGRNGSGSHLFWNVVT
eukprot:s250_g29.t1